MSNVEFFYNVCRKTGKCPGRLARSRGSLLTWRQILTVPPYHVGKPGRRWWKCVLGRGGGGEGHGTWAPIARFTLCAIYWQPVYMFWGPRQGAKPLAVSVRNNHSQISSCHLGSARLFSPSPPKRWHGASTPRGLSSNRHTCGFFFCVQMDRQTSPL